MRSELAKPPEVALQQKLCIAEPQHEYSSLETEQLNTRADPAGLRLHLSQAVLRSGGSWR